MEGVVRVGQRVAPDRFPPIKGEGYFKVALAIRSLAERPAFMPSDTFAGPRAGFVFKAGPKGVGYYRDDPPCVA